MSSPPVVPWSHAPVASDWNGSGTLPRLAWFATRPSLPPALDRASTALGITAEARPLAGLIDGSASLPDLIWANIDDGTSDDDLLALRDRIDSEALNPVIEVTRRSIDPVWSLLGDSDGVTILIEPEEGDCLSALAHGLRTSQARFNSPLVEARDQQLERLQEEVQRIARLLARLNVDDSANIARMPDGSRSPASPFIEDHMHAPSRGFHGEDAAPQAAVSPAQVRLHIRQRRLREEYFGPDIFADPAWDMMLDLYAARLERLRVSVSSLCIAAAVPATTALRWIRTLTESGLFERREDPHDGRRIFVALSDQATQLMHRYFHRIAVDF